VDDVIGVLLHGRQLTPSYVKSQDHLPYVVDRIKKKGRWAQHMLNGLSILVPFLVRVASDKFDELYSAGLTLRLKLRQSLQLVKQLRVGEDAIRKIVPMMKTNRIYNMAKASAKEERDLARSKWKKKKDRRSGIEYESTRPKYAVGDCPTSKAIWRWCVEIRNLIDLVNYCHSVDPSAYCEAVKSSLKYEPFTELYASGRIPHLGNGKSERARNCLWKALAWFDALLDNRPQARDEDWQEIKRATLRFITSNPDANIDCRGNLRKLSNVLTPEIVRLLHTDAPAPDCVLGAYCALYDRTCVYYSGPNRITYGRGKLVVPLSFVVRGEVGHWSLNFAKAVRNIQKYNQELHNMTHQPQDANTTEEIVIVELPDEEPQVAPILANPPIIPPPKEDHNPAPPCCDTATVSTPVVQSESADLPKPEPVKVEPEEVDKSQSFPRVYEYTFTNNFVSWMKKLTVAAVGAATCGALCALGRPKLGITALFSSVAVAASLVDRTHVSITLDKPEKEDFVRNHITESSETLKSTSVEAEMTITPVCSSLLPTAPPGRSRLFDFYRNRLPASFGAYRKKDRISLEVFDASLHAQSCAGFMAEDVAYDHLYRLYRTQDDYHVNSHSLFSSDFSTRCSMMIYNIRKAEQQGFMETLSKIRR
jgi:hypothetical protein